MCPAASAPRGAPTRRFIRPEAGAGARVERVGDHVSGSNGSQRRSGRHNPDVVFAPLAGVFADRWDRKAIMVTTNVAAAAVVGAVALEAVNGSGCQRSDPPYFRWPGCVMNMMPGLLPILS